ncbi:hypothetical protein ABEB36_011880 [Hypothenemus hampei]|uniref:Uncharacterized protein n=1 Tax=Hypothenemus hampei TaxID=57062 RepID=A0ABD1EA29_HYPHA
MHCKKIVLTTRDEKTKRHDKQLNGNGNVSYLTTKHYGYSYKFSGRNRERTPKDPASLSITTLIFPENVSTFNTGSSLERWSRKSTPTVLKRKFTPLSARRTFLDDQYLDEDNFLNNEEAISEQEQHQEDDNQWIFNDYYLVSSDIEELLLKSQREESVEEKKSKGHKKKGRNKMKKTIRFSFSKPPSPETEQVIRVDVTSSVSVEESAQLEQIRRKKDGNNNDKDEEQKKEEDFIVKCQQLALTQKK